MVVATGTREGGSPGMHEFATKGAGPAPGRPAFRGGTLRRAFIGRFLDTGVPPRRRMKNNAEASRLLLELSLKDLGGEPVTRPTPETDERLARTLASEAVAAVLRTGGKNATNWYTESIERAVAVAGLLHPEVVDDAAAAARGDVGFSDASDARTVLFCAMAITSQNVPVSENMGYALEQYRAYLRIGRFDPKGYGIRGGSVKGNLERFNHMLDVFDGDLKSLRAFLTSEFSMRELVGAAEAAGIGLGGREMMDEKVHGGMVFGPKIGNGFLMNLFGNYSPVTIDLWMMRTWGRVTGTLVRNACSPEQVARFAGSLRLFSDGMLDHLSERVVVPDPDDVADMDPEDLLLLADAMKTAWNRHRRDLVKGGAGNEELAALKARLEWPNAASAVAEALSATVDAPVSAGQRRWIRRVVARSLELLHGKGYSMTAAQFQAVLWYPEKSLYAHLTGRRENTYNTSYDEAIISIARSEGHDETRIEAVLQSVGAYGARGPGNPGTAGPGHAGRLQGDGQDAGGIAFDPDQAGGIGWPDREVIPDEEEVPSFASGMA